MFGRGKSSKSTSSSGPTFFDIRYVYWFLVIGLALMFLLINPLSFLKISLLTLHFRVKSTYKNLVIVKGSQYESPSVILQGHLVFSLPDTMSAKKISLKLVGKYKLDFLEVLAHSRSTVSSPVKQEAVVFEIDWDNLLVNSEGVTTVGTDTKITTTNGSESSRPYRHGISGASSSTTSTSTSSTTLPKKSNQSTKKLHRPNAPSSLVLPINGVSGTPFENVKTPNGISFILQGGNYDLPFKCVIPGDIPETVEGLVAGSILYKFEASIDRGSFKSPINKFKYFRIFRTLSSDNLQLSETMQIGKTWPGKVQYEVSIPARAVPIGGKSPLNILLVPLIKGMKLGPIKAQIIQYYAFKGITGDVYDDQQQILDLTMSQMENHILDDKLSIESFIDIPGNLKKVTQDCDLKQDLIKVRHKLKIQINLILPNGHISELRANLPISLYVSPNAEITGRTIVLDKQGKIHFRKEEEPLFERNKHLPGQTREEQFKLAQQEDSAPPNYEAHIYDRLYGDSNNNSESTSNSGVNSGATSGATSPMLTPGPTSPLPILQNQSQQNNNGNTLSPGSISDVGNISEDISYFGLPTRPTESSPVSPLLEASIHNKNNGGNGGSFSGGLNIGSVGGGISGSIDDELSKSLEALKFPHISDLPTYQDAIDADDDDDEIQEFAPNYEDSDTDDIESVNNTINDSNHSLTIGSNSFGGLGSNFGKKNNSSGNKFNISDSSTNHEHNHGHSRSISAITNVIHSRHGSLSGASINNSNKPSSTKQSPILSSSSTTTSSSASVSTRPSPVGKIELPKIDFSHFNSNLHSPISSKSSISNLTTGLGSPNSLYPPQPSRPSTFRSSSLNNILSKHGSSSSTTLNSTKTSLTSNGNKSPSGTKSPLKSGSKSPSISSSNLSKLAYKKFLKKEKK